VNGTPITPGLVAAANAEYTSLTNGAGGQTAQQAGSNATTQGSPSQTAQTTQGDAGTASAGEAGQATDSPSVPRVQGTEDIVVVGQRRYPLETVGWGRTYGFLVESLKNGGMRRIKPLFDKAQAVFARKHGKEVMLRSQQAASAVEEAAKGEGEKLLRHNEGHPLRNGEQGYPHYQTKGREGHSFWGGFEDLLDTIIPFPPVIDPRVLEPSRFEEDRGPPRT